MKRRTGKLYAIYKNEIHLGNERGNSKEHAIKSYLIAAGLNIYLNDLEFENKYSAKIAVNGFHHYWIKPKALK